MRHFISIAICLLLSFTVVQAADLKYVTDRLQITMRTGQGLEHKILAMIKSGEEVEALQEDGQWTMIRLSDGKEGWVLSRFLTSKKPNRIMLEELEKMNETLSSQNALLVKENEELKGKTEQISADLAEKEKNLQKHKSAYESLKQEYADFLKLKANYKESVKIQKELTEKTNKMEEELNYLRTQHIFKWFLAGAGVLLFGFLIGFSARRSRRRSSLL